MPVQVSYPGVYIEEIPSGVHTIVGVPTSVTAFVGRCAKGPVNEPTTCFSFADFVRFFGVPGSDQNHVPFTMSYAAQDFFTNGGGQAIIVRLVEEEKTTPPQSGQAKATPGQPEKGGEAAKPTGGQAAKPSPAKSASESKNPTGCNLIAASDGSWGNDLMAWVDYDGLKQNEQILFNLNIKVNSATQPATERFVNCSVKPDAGSKRLDRVLEQGSTLVRVDPDKAFPSSRPQKASIDPTTQKPVAATFGGGGDGPPLSASTLEGDPSNRTGIYALENVDVFNILCILPELEAQSGNANIPGSVTLNPGDVDNGVLQKAAAFCVKRRAMLIVDSPTGWLDSVKQNQFQNIDPSSFNFTEDQARNSAVYFPRILRRISVDEKMSMVVFPACGAIAGQMASTDLRRGVWKAPAGIETALGGIDGLELKIGDGQNGQLNPIGINCLRTFPVLGSLIWGARTLRGADDLSDDYKYVPVRRLTLYVEESLYRGTKWAVFEPNDEPLWSSLRSSIGSFMADLSRQGAFYDYQVICDKTTTTARDIELGIVNVVVAFAPVKPAEFVVLKIQQEAGRAPA